MKLGPVIADVRRSAEKNDSDWLLELSLALRVWAANNRGNLEVIPEEQITSTCYVLGSLALILALERSPRN